MGRPERRAGGGIAVHNRLEHLQELLEAHQALGSGPGPLPERGGVGAFGTGSEAEVEAPVAHVVECEGVPGERDRMAEVGRGDEGAERTRSVTAAAAASTGTAACQGPSGMPPHRTWSYVHVV